MMALLSASLISLMTGATLAEGVSGAPRWPLQTSSRASHLTDATESSTQAVGKGATGVTGDTQLLLSPSVDGTPAPADELITVIRHPDGSMAARASDLRRLRIKIDPSVADASQVALSSIQGLVVTYDEGAQAIDFRAPDDMLTPYIVGLGGARERVQAKDLQNLSGFVLNYGVFNTVLNGRVSTAATFDGLGMTPIGLFDAQVKAWVNSPYYGTRAVVDAVSWRYFDENRLRSYTLGDFTSNALTWTNSVRLAGIQIASSFTQRGDIVTTSLPSFNGSAAVPSTIDLYVNQQRIYSGQLPSGPFDLRELPYMANGDVRMVTTDANGRQAVVVKPFYYVQNSLKAGLTQYSIDVGVPRIDYDLKSLEYDDVVFASASVRHGVNDRLTLESHVEASSDGLVMGGAGAVLSVGKFGAITASGEISRFQGQTGERASVRLEAGLAGVQAFAQTQLVFGDFFDLAKLAQVRYLNRAAALANSAGNAGDSTAITSVFATRADQAGLTFSIRPLKANFSATYNYVNSAGSRYRSLQFSANRPFGSLFNLTASALVGLDGSPGVGGFLTLSIQPQRKLSISAQAADTAGAKTLALQIAHNTTGDQDELGWSAYVSHDQDGSTDERVSATYYARQAMLRGEVDHVGGAWQGEFDAQGSFIVTGGAAFFANQIGDSFVVVRDAGADTDIRLGGVKLAKTDGSGNALLSNVPPYQWHHIYVDPTNLPEGWELTSTDQTVATGYRRGAVVNFGAHQVVSAVIILKDANGEMIKPGYTAVLADGTSGIVGYDGRVYLENLKAANHLTIDLGPKGICAVDFTYAADTPAGTVLGPLTCK